MNNATQGPWTPARSSWVKEHATGLICQGIMIASYIILMARGFAVAPALEIIAYLYVAWPILLLILSAVATAGSNTTWLFPVFNIVLAAVVITMVDTGTWPGMEMHWPPNWQLYLVVLPIYAVAAFIGYTIGKAYRQFVGNSRAHEQHTAEV